MPLGPLLDQYEDDGSRDLCTLTVQVDDIGTFEVALVGTPQRAELIRVATLDSDGNLTPSQLETVGKLMDHSLAILRLTVDSSYDRLRFGDKAPSLGAHSSNNKPSLKVQMTERGEISSDTWNQFRNTLAVSIESRPLVILLADAGSPSLPLQYRYLSLYKILELEFRSAGRWVGLKDFLDPYTERYRELGISERSLVKVIHEVRDKCAHIKVGGSDALGVLGLSGEDARVVAKLTELLRQIVADRINAKQKGFAIETPNSDSEWHAR